MIRPILIREVGNLWYLLVPGQIASAKIPLSRMISPQLYWVMSGDDFTLDINNPDDPKILCVGNNPDRHP